MKAKATLDDNGILVIEDGVKFLNEETLQGIEISKVSELRMSDSIEEIEGNLFRNAFNLRNIIFSKNLKKIGKFAFSCCFKLNSIDLPKGLIELGENCFSNCSELSYVNLPESLIILKKECFNNCKIKSIFIPKNVQFIGYQIFSSNYLKEIKVDKDNAFYSDLDSNLIFRLKNRELVLGCGKSKIIEGIEIVSKSAFAGCLDLTEINLPSSLKEIQYMAFANTGIKRLNIPSNIAKIEDSAFERCCNLSIVRLEEGVKTIPYECFFYCERIDELYLPNGIFIGQGSFHKTHIKNLHLTKDVDISPLHCSWLDVDNIFIKTGESEIKISEQIKRIKMSDFGLVFLTQSNNIYFPNGNSAYLCLNVRNFNLKNEWTNDFLAEELDLIPRVYCWRNEKSLPSKVVVKNMPIESIKHFHKDNNSKNWYSILVGYKLLSKKDTIKNLEKECLFKIAYALGVFSQNSKRSQFATKYIISQILPIIENPNLQKILNAFETKDNEYLNDFSDFFVKYFDAKDFKTFAKKPKNDFFLAGLSQEQKQLISAKNLIFNNDDNEQNFFSLAFNKFHYIKEIYSNKFVKTELEKERLTPDLVASTFIKIAYQNVNEKAKELSEMCARYSFTQEQFQKVQNWYLEGIEVGEKFTQAHILPDTKNFGFNYKVLEKNDVIIPVLGILTNCCQKLDDLAESCIEYGMTKSNSGFIKIEYDGELFGQIWFWYDDLFKQLTFDNIEFPKKFEPKLKANEHLREELISCINRLTINAKLGMETNGFEVNEITMGLGFNSIKELLLNRFEEKIGAKKLSDYKGYTDASKQVILFSKERVFSESDISLNSELRLNLIEKSAGY